MIMRRGEDEGRRGGRRREEERGGHTWVKLSSLILARDT
jgi:hypothetical protein